MSENRIVRFDILTIFPELFRSLAEEGIIRRAIQAEQVKIVLHNIRDFALDKHAMTDDRPFGGGEGMVMKPEPIIAALEHVQRQEQGGRIILLSPQGKLFDQEKAAELAQEQRLTLICGRYEGIDSRIRDHFADEEISIGDYILSGGELAAMVLVDSVIRLIPGVLGCADSVANETFSRGLLKYSQYTRPRELGPYKVPEVLLSGDHARIDEYRFVDSVQQTKQKRPDLLARMNFSPQEVKILRKSGLDVSLNGPGHDTRNK